MLKRVEQEEDRGQILPNIVDEEKDIIITSVITNMEEEMNVIIEGIRAPVQRNAAMMKRQKPKKDNKKFVWR
jgi:hypothetical protein